MKNKKNIIKIAAAAIIIALIATKGVSYLKKELAVRNEKSNLIKGAITSWDKKAPAKWNADETYQIKSNPESTDIPVLYLVVDLLSTDSAGVFQDLLDLHEKNKTQFSLSFYPLDDHCNSNITFRSDGSSCKLTAAVMCAQMHFSKGFEFTKLIFSENKNLLLSPEKRPEILEAQVAKLGMDKNKIQECMQGILSGSLIKTSADGLKKISFTRVPVILYKDKVYDASLIQNGVAKLLEENP